jgi:hypothetical protein
VRITDLSDDEHVVFVNGAFKQRTALALLATAMEIFIETSGLSFDQAARALSRVMEQNKPIFETSDIAVVQ